MDAANYRRAETLARQVMSTWRLGQAHHPAAFEQAGFPLRVESAADLFQLLDTMQEQRFRPYQEEMGGLSEPEVGEFAGALAAHAEFVGRAFHASRAPLPLATMLAHYALATKIKGWPTHRDVLEIGPGCGYLSFFLDGIDRYDQVESCESFYLLQYLVNDHCLAGDQVEHAALDPFVTRASLCAEPAGTELTIPVNRPAPRCHHWPWWKLGEVSTQRYDIVTANACLNEFSEAALMQYADLVDKVLRDDGALIVQCFGGGATPTKTIIETFLKRGLVPLLLAEAGHPSKRWAVPNALWVRSRHPTAVGRKIFSSAIGTLADPLAAGVYAVKPGPRRIYGASEIAERVVAHLAA